MSPPSEAFDLFCSIDFSLERPTLWITMAGNGAELSETNFGWMPKMFKWHELVPKSDAELATIGIENANIACASGLRGSESLNGDICGSSG